jgi:hypothetical protein
LRREIDDRDDERRPFGRRKHSEFPENCRGYDVTVEHEWLIDHHTFAKSGLRGWAPSRLLHCTIEGASDPARSWCRFDRSGTRHKEPCHMSIQMHLAELERRHQALEDELNDAINHPSSDDIRIADLKRRKLQVKDEISRLQVNASVH